MEKAKLVAFGLAESMIRTYMPANKPLDLSPLQIRAFLLCATGSSQKEVAQKLKSTPATISELLLNLAETFLPKSDFELPPKNADKSADAKVKKKRNPLFESDSSLSRKGMWVREILQDVDAAFRNLEKQVSPNRQSLGFSKSCTGLMNVVLDRLGRGQPDIQYELVSDSSQVLTKAVVSARIDVALVLDEVLEREKAEGMKKWEYDPLLRVGGFKQKSRLYVSLADPFFKDVTPGSQLNIDQLKHLFCKRAKKWVWYHPKYLPGLFGKISRYGTRYCGNGFAVSYPLYDQESLYGCIIANKGMAILPEAVALGSYPGIVAYDLPNGFPKWRYGVIRHQSNSHPFVLSTCEPLVQCG